MINSNYTEQLDRAMKRLDAGFFFYDLDGLKVHLEKMASGLPPGVKLWYACKANPLSAILKILRNLKFGIDVASEGELTQALSSGVKPQDILSTGPSKPPHYLKALLENDVDIVVLESLNQAYWLDEIAGEMKRSPKVLLRVQLEWKQGKSVLGGNAITPFGLDPKAWEALDLSRCQNLNFQGFHVFQWGNILDIEQLKSIWWHTTSEMQKLATSLKLPLNILDLGGGLGIPYDTPSHQMASPLEFSAVAELLKQIKADFKIPTIWMELGRYVVGEFGYYFTRVSDKKSVRGKNILVLEGGINHIARPALTGQSFPCHLYRSSQATPVTYQVHGPLCTALDILGEFELPSDIQVGDWVYFSKAGAYGFTESMPFFLCHTLPGEVLIYNGDMVTPRHPKKLLDWPV